MGESGRRLIALEAEAMYTLGLHHELGLAGTDDDVEAVAWHTLAAVDGHAEALHHLRRLDRILSPDQLDQARVRTRQLYEEVRTWRALG